MHKHAEILMEIAKEAAVNPDPLSVFYCHSTREAYKDQPLAADDITALIAGGFPFEFFDIRRKPRTIRIGDIDVPEPIDAGILHSDIFAVRVQFKSKEDADAFVNSLTQKKE